MVTEKLKKEGDKTFSGARWERGPWGEKFNFSIRRKYTTLVFSHNPNYDFRNKKKIVLIVGVAVADWNRPNNENGGVFLAA